MVEGCSRQTDSSLIWWSAWWRWKGAIACPSNKRNALSEHPDAPEHHHRTPLLPATSGSAAFLPPSIYGCFFFSDDSKALCDLDVGRREKGPARPAGRQCVHGRQPGRDSQDAQVEHAQDFDTGQPPGGGVQSPAIRRSRSSTARHHLPLTPSSLTHTLSHAALTVAVSTVRPRTRAPLSHTLSHTHAAWMASTSTLHPRARARKVISTPQVGRARESMPRGHPRTT